MTACNIEAKKGEIMKITIRRGTSRKTYGFAINWKIFADGQLVGLIKDKETKTFELNSVKEIKITGLFLGETVIPLNMMDEDIEIRCFIHIGMWKGSIYAYAISKGEYIGEYNF